MSLGGKLSAVGLGLLGFLCTVITLLLNHIVNPCNLVNLPDLNGSLSPDACATMMNGASNALPKADREAGKNLMFVIALVCRIEAAAFVAFAIGCWYAAIAVPFYKRGPAILIGVVFSTLMFCIEGSHAGLFTFGVNPALNEWGITLSQGPLTVVWLVISCMLWPAFYMSIGAKEKMA